MSKKDLNWKEFHENAHRLFLSGEITDIGVTFYTAEREIFVPMEWFGIKFNTIEITDYGQTVCLDGNYEIAVDAILDEFKMTKQKTYPIKRLLITKEGEMWAVQGMERKMISWGSSIDTAMKFFCENLDEKILIDKAANKEPFSGLATADDELEERYYQASPFELKNYSQIFEIRLREEI
jgi:hypothetical protein